ncbi:MAG: hypothetical protein Q7S12_00155 [bacterium]|nr:hypothetical protein [bacterium]
MDKIINPHEDFTPTLEEIMTLWESYKLNAKLTPDEAWDAIAAGLALQMIFSPKHERSVIFH